ncbi:hypothetical protein REPUB_Repub11eG0013600 [Reevesia pubescens]
MAPVVYYKFKSSRDYHSIPIDAPFISVSAFKAQIFASKLYGTGKDFDLLISHAQTDEEYADGSSLIPANSSLLVRRVPGKPQLPIVIAEEKEKQNIENNPSSVVMNGPQEEEKGFDFHDFGLDFNSIPKNSTVNPRNTHCKEDKTDDRFKFLAVKEFGKTKIPPQGYVCRRCKAAGHYIQHCPTNGDPRFDFKTVKPATGISTASSASSSTSSGRVVENILPEFCCPLCKKIMKNAALAKCCFASFCDKCIRDRIVSKSVCVCQRKIVADDILPNMTLRDTISRIMNLNQSGDVASDNTRSEAANMKRKRLHEEKELQGSGETEEKRMRKTGTGKQRCYNRAILRQLEQLPLLKS